MEYNRNFLNELEIHYILSRNRSGSNLLVNLINGHPNISCISELNAYWLLQTDYKNIKKFDKQTVEKLVNDLFFILNKKGNEFTEYMLPDKDTLKQILLSQIHGLNFKEICRLINLHVKTSLTDKKYINSIIKKDINFNHLINKIYQESPKTKFILLVRNHRANIYSSLKFNAVKNNCIYEAKRWALEMKPLVYNTVPSNKKLIIKYKDLINNTEECLKKIQLFLEIPPQNDLVTQQQQLTKDMIYKEAKNYNLNTEKIDSFIKHHYGSFSRINPNKINEWEHKQAFTKIQLKKIDYICKDVAIPLGFKCSTEKVPFSTIDYYYIIRAVIDYYIVSKYISLPISYKRFLERVNVFNFFN